MIPLLFLSSWITHSSKRRYSIMKTYKIDPMPRPCISPTLTANLFLLTFYQFSTTALGQKEAFNFCFRRSITLWAYTHSQPGIVWFQVCKLDIPLAFLQPLKISLSKDEIVSRDAFMLSKTVNKCWYLLFTDGITVTQQHSKNVFTVAYKKTEQIL